MYCLFSRGASPSYTQTDSDEDLIFVPKRPTTFIIDQEKRLALQKDIDQESQPSKPAKHLACQRMVALEMKKEVANSDRSEKKEKRRKATQPEREVSSIIEESEGGVKERKKKNNAQVPVKIEETSNQDRGAETEKKVTHNDTANDTHNHDVKDIHGFVQETSKNKKALAGKNGAKVDAEDNGGKVARNSVKEEVAEGKKKKKSVQSEHPVENIKVEDGEKLGAEEDVQKKVKKGHNVKEMNSIGQETSKKKKKKVEAECNGGEVVCNSVKEEVSEGKEQREKKMKNKYVQSEPPVENIKVENGEKVGAEVKLLKKAKKEKKGQIVASTTCTEGTEDLMKGMKKRKKRSSALAEQDRGEGVSAKKMVKELVPKVEMGAVEGETVKKKRKKEAAKMQGEEPSVEAEILEVKHQVNKKRKNKDAEAATQKEGEIEESQHTNNRDEAMDRVVNEVKTEQESKNKGLKEKSEKQKGLKEKSEKEELKEKKRKAPVLTTLAGRIKGKKEGKNPPGVEIKIEKEAEVEEGDGKKRKKNKKIKVEHCDSEKQHGQEVASHTDVVFLSKKHGNTDEMTINQQRRLALQMEVDKASQPQTQPTTSGLGQWASAQFDSSEKQQKFLRLMGGFKKGAQPAGSIAGQENMALDKEAQNNLQQALLGEFEQAQSRRMDFNNKGSGLGFTAPSNKKFAIDVNACRSVRFDD